MSKSINTIVISGNLGADPETKTFASGASVTEFTVCVNDWFKPKDGEGQERTYFIRCKAWGKTGERIAEFFAKGYPILVDGKLTQEEWEKDGKKQSKTLVNVENWYFMGGDKKEPKTQSDLPKQKAKAPADPDLDSVEGEEIPF